MSRPSRYSAIRPAERLPAWIRSPLGAASSLEAVQAVVKGPRLHTICEEGRCPNRGECYAAGTATFLLGGPICTRSCAFCQVDKGTAPAPFDAQEAERVAEAVEQLGLRYVVLTAVARDDLLDHGAQLFTGTMAAIRRRQPQVAIEVLTPDFWGGMPRRRPRSRPSGSGWPRCWRRNRFASTTTSKPWNGCRGRCDGGLPIAVPSACLPLPGSWRPPFPPNQG